MKRSILVGVTILVGTILVGRNLVRAQESSLKANSMIIGTWKQNMEKSTYRPGPAPKGTYAVRQYAAGEDGSVVAVTMNVDAQGLPSLNAVAAANYDGKEYVQYTVATLATQLGSHIGPRIDRTISYKPLDAYTVQIVQKQDEQIVSIYTRTISQNGRTMTEQQDFTNVEGQRVQNILVFEKQ
ncbi:MAG TPA: hypothetical protein VKY31_04915 [Terriglobia bacterium]|nr:hypothetical protein [Terriglobia bacterium]